jgi:hypothetical protein
MPYYKDHRIDTSYPDPGCSIVLPLTIKPLNTLLNAVIFNPVMNNLPSIFLLFLAFTLILLITLIYLLLIILIYYVNIRTLPAVSTFSRGSRCEVFVNMRYSRIYFRGSRKFVGAMKMG